VRIGDRVKNPERHLVYKGVTVEDDALLGPHMVSQTDLYPRAFQTTLTKSCPTLVKKGASVGANATIVCGGHAWKLLAWSGAGAGGDGGRARPLRWWSAPGACRWLRLRSGQTAGGGLQEQADSKVACDRCGKQSKSRPAQIAVI